jgi:hypothetical protein
MPEKHGIRHTVFYTFFVNADKWDKKNIYRLEKIRKFGILSVSLTFISLHMRNYILYTSMFGLPMYFEFSPLSGFKLCNDKKQAEIFNSKTDAKLKAEELFKISGYVIEIEPIRA